MNYDNFFMQYSKIREQFDFSEMSLSLKDSSEFKKGKNYIITYNNEIKKQYLFYHSKDEQSQKYLYVVEFLNSESGYWRIDFRTVESNFDRPNIGRSGIDVFKKLRKLILTSGIKKFCFFSSRDEKRYKLKTVRDRVFESAIYATFDCDITWKEIDMPRQGRILVGYFEI